MKLAVITTKFLEEYVRYTLGKLHVRCDIEIYIYRDFRHVGDLYLELEEQFDGFLVSGPVPKAAILRRVGQPKKPVKSFGSDSQCYYETFFRVLYEQKDANLENGYFDLLEWAASPQELSTYLSSGTFGKLLDQVYETTMLRSLPEIAELEQRVLEKHLSLWREGKIQYSVTRFSSIMPHLQKAGVKVYFVYPHLELIRSALNNLIKDIDLHRMYGNQPTVIRLGLRGDDLTPDEVERRLNDLEQALSDYNQERFCGFVIQRGKDGLNVFSQLREIRRITEDFQSCALRLPLQKRCGFSISVGYGLGADVSHAMVNAVAANRDSTTDPLGYSYLRDEANKSIGPLKESQSAADAPISAYIRDTAKRLHISATTVQRLLTAMTHLATDQVTSQALASALGLTVRSANRILSNLVQHGGAEILFENQSCSKGRPERVYRLLLDAAF